MATKVFKTEEIEFQDGTVLEIRPLNIKRLRKFMEIVKEFDKVEEEDESVDLMVRACAIAIEKADASKAKDTEWLEENLDMPTMWKILEVAGGVKANDPNPLAAGL